MVEYWRLGRG